MIINNVYFQDTVNVGDNACAPHQYYPQLKGKMVPVQGQTNQVDLNCFAVVGGGGVLHPETLDSVYRAWERASIAVAWGIGTNLHGALGPHYPEWLDRYSLVGLRDANPPSWAEWVPCASCLHPIFDEALSAYPLYDYVLYEHPHAPMPSAWAGPRRSNWTSAPNGVKDIVEAVRFLASGVRVITNTYHGMYWAKLLGKPVVLWKPFSSRFHCSGFDVSYSYTDDLKECIKSVCGVATGGDWLERCRLANREFAEKVLDLLTFR